MKLYDYLLTYSSPIALGFGVLCGAYYYRFLDSTNQRVLLYLGLSLSFDIVTRLVGHYYGNNLIFWPILGIAELLFFSWFYLKVVENKGIVWFLTVGGATYIIAEILRVDVWRIPSFQSYAKVVAAFLIVLMVLLHFATSIRNNTVVSGSGLFLNQIILIYYSLNIILLLPINFLINQGSDITAYVWTLYLLVTVSFYSSLTHFLWKNGKNLKRLRYGL